MCGFKSHKEPVMQTLFLQIEVSHARAQGAIKFGGLTLRHNLGLLKVSAESRSLV